MDNWRLEHLKGLLQEDEKDEFVLYALAQEYLKLDQPMEALAHFLKLKKYNEQYVGLYYHLAALYIELGEDDNAMNTFNEGIAIAKALGDQHALGELMNARTNLELGI